MKIKKSFNFYSEIEFNNKFEYVYKWKINKLAIYNL
jgi:hypothetical protein